jgi:hypothetical protein
MAEGDPRRADRRRGGVQEGVSRLSRGSFGSVHAVRSKRLRIEMRPVKRESTRVGELLDETRVGSGRGAPSVIEVGDVEGGTVVGRKPLKEIEEDDRINASGDGDEDRLAARQHPVPVNRRSNAFQEHGSDCGDEILRNQRLVEARPADMLRPQ